MIAAMATAFPNLIDGRSVESTDRTPDINPSNIQRHRRRVRPRDTRGRRARGGRRPGRPSASGRCRTRRSDSTFSIAPARRSWRARKSSGGSCRASRGSRWPTAMGEAGRAGAIFKYLRRRGGAHPRRQARLGAARASRSRSRASRSGVVGPHHAVELSAGDSGVEDRAGARLRQLRRLQAGGAGPGVAVVARRHPPARRPATRRPEPRHGAGLEDRSGDHLVTRRRCGELHRVAGHRRRDRRRRGQERHARAARDGRQESAHRARRCRSGDGGVGRGQRRLLPDRPALHGVEPPHRHRGHSRSLHRRHDRAHEAPRR